MSIATSNLGSAQIPDLTSTEFVSQAADRDGDGLPDHLEFNIGTNPDLPDTDFDGLIDGFEYAAYTIQVAGSARLVKTSPLNPDTDGDGLLDGDEMLGKLKITVNGKEVFVNLRFFE